MNEIVKKRTDRTRIADVPLKTAYGIRFTSIQHQQIAIYCLMKNIEKSAFVRSVVGDFLTEYFKKIDTKMPL